MPSRRLVRDRLILWADSPLPEPDAQRQPYPPPQVAIALFQKLPGSLAFDTFGDIAHDGQDRGCTIPSILTAGHIGRELATIETAQRQGLQWDGTVDANFITAFQRAGTAGDGHEVSHLTTDEFLRTRRTKNAGSSPVREDDLVVYMYKNGIRAHTHDLTLAFLAFQKSILRCDLLRDIANNHQNPRCTFPIDGPEPAFAKKVGAIKPHTPGFENIIGAFTN